MIDLQPACQGMVEVVQGTTDDQLALATPCDEYTVGDLVDHVDLVTRGALALARRDEAELARTADGPRPTHREPDWRSVLADQLAALGAAWADPVAWQGGGGVPGSDLSNETWGKITLTELVVHGWDLARATGQPFDLPVPTLRACLDHVAVFVPNAPVPTLWRPPVVVAPDAPLLDRIVAITGRRP